MEYRNAEQWEDEGDLLTVSVYLLQVNCMQSADRVQGFRSSQERGARSIGYLLVSSETVSGLGLQQLG